MPKVALISDIESKSTIDNKPVITPTMGTRGCTYDWAWDTYEVAPAESYKDSYTNKLILNTGLLSNHGTANIPIKFQRASLTTTTSSLSIGTISVLSESSCTTVATGTNLSIPGTIFNCPFFVSKHSFEICLIQARLVVSPVPSRPVSYTLRAALENDGTVIDGTIQTIGTVTSNALMQFSNIKFTIPKYYNVNLITQIRFYF